MMAWVGRRVGPVVLVGAMLAACGGPAATPTPTAVPTPTPAPTPSPTPDPLSALRASLAAPGYRASADFTGTLDVGPAYDLEGRLEIDGDDLSLAIVIDLGATKQATRQVLVDDTTYLGQGEPMLWRQVPELSGARRPTPFAEALAALELTPSATGWTAEGPAVGPVLAAMGFADPSTVLSAPRITVEAGPDGSLRAITLAFDATRGTQESTWAVALTFDATPSIAPIGTPSPLWVAFDPGRDYTVWHPEGWTPEVDSAADYADFYWSPGDTEAVSVACIRGDVPTLRDWVADALDFYAGEWGSEPDERYDGRTLGGRPAVVLVWHAANVEGQETLVLSISAVTEELACDVQWFSDPGNETEDAALFAGFVASFAFAN
jgi:hypothetical protein